MKNTRQPTKREAEPVTNPLYGKIDELVDAVFVPRNTGTEPKPQPRPKQSARR